jgi:hypothetical protein
MAALWWTDESGLEFEAMAEDRHTSATEEASFGDSLEYEEVSGERPTKACENCKIDFVQEACKTCGLGFCSRECNEAFRYVLATKAVS